MYAKDFFFRLARLHVFLRSCCAHVYLYKASNKMPEGLSESRKRPAATDATQSRPRRQRRAPARFEFDSEHGYSEKFLREITQKSIKDVDENWEELDDKEVLDSLSEPEPESPDESWCSDEVSESEESEESLSVVEDEDEYEDEDDDELSDVIDLNALPEDDDESEEMDSDAEVGESSADEKFASSDEDSLSE